MGSRRGAFSFSRHARSAFNSFRNSSAAASQTTRAARRTKNLFENGSGNTTRRRFAETMIHLHNAVASAKLVTQLSVSSRSSRALSLALQGYFYASYQFMPSVRGNLSDLDLIL